jgi:L-iditol 2-dehydrogenase
MKAAALYGARDLRLVEVDEAPLVEDEVRVAVSHVGLCGSDLHFYTHGRVGAFDLQGPQIIGHEAAGVVVETGPTVRGVHVGDRVAIEPGRPCGACPECARGTYNLCPDIAFMGMPPLRGCLAERAVVREALAHRIPDAMTLEEGALLEPLSVAVWSITRGNVSLGERVLIAGAGPIGILVARVARAAGAAGIVLLDVDAGRLGRLATESGVSGVDVSGGWGDLPQDFDCFFECTGAPPALGEGLKHLRRRGRAILVGVPSTPDIAIPSIVTRFRELTITTVHRYAHTWPRAIQLVSSGRVPVRDLVTQHYSLEETPRALEDSAGRNRGLKSMVTVAPEEERVSPV